MRILVTGSSGFLGRHYVDYFRDKRYDVDTIDIRDRQGVDRHRDAMNLFDTPSTATHYDLVVHAAARGPNRKAIDTQPANLSYNTMLDAAMFRWAIESKQGHVLYLSSSAVYADHNSPSVHHFSEEFDFFDRPAFDSYGTAKRWGEAQAMAADRAGLNVTIVRPFSGYGSDQSADFPFGAFLKRAFRKEDPFTIWGSSTQMRDFIHVDDIVRGSMVLVDGGVTGTPINLCTGVGTSMFSLACMIWAEVNGGRPRIHTDELAPMGVYHRVGSPDILNEMYMTKVTLLEGVRRAVKERS